MALQLASQLCSRDSTQGLTWILSIVFLVSAPPLPMTPPSSFLQVTGTIFVVFRASRSHMVGTVSTNPFPLYN